MALESFMRTSVLKRVGTRMAVPVAAAMLCAPGWVVAAEGTPAAESAQSAVWTPKELKFVYMGFTTKYSCDGLRDKVRGVLLDLGVQKKGLQVRESGCSSSAGRPDPFPGVRVKMNVLQPAGGSDANPVEAHWKPVDLKLRDSFSMDSGECELVEQIKSAILPLFATRNVELSANCIPHQASASRPVLKLEVLAVDQKDEKKAPAN
jgi:hypothetical protein